MHRAVYIVVILLLPFSVCCGQTTQDAGKEVPSQVVFPSLDKTPVTGQLYWVQESTPGHDSSRPFIVLCHQAGWSRGEYLEIAPQLNAMGFNCMAIDQRSGGTVNEVKNETAAQASSAGKETGFIDAEQDILAAIQYVRDTGYGTGKVVLWGSSYSAALALRIAGEHPDLVDGVLAFAPGEYFGRFDKPKDWIESSARKIKVPAFITSARNEARNWSAIFEAIPGDSRTRFIPTSKGNHGSRALWKQFDDSDDYWNATREFLEPFRKQDPDSASAPTVRSVDSINGLPRKIAFGSCGHQDKPQPILNTIVDQNPDLFIYLGDNIYGDTTDMKVLQQKYNSLGAKPEFQKLREQIPVLSIWDDHDYGWNDSGKEYKFRSESQAIFLDFWQVPETDPRRSHDGIYGVHRFESDGKALQVILLDTRYFRDPLKHNEQPLPEGSRFKNQYQPDPDSEKTMLGDVQWKWLEQVLREPADIRIICSSIQFGHEYNGWESWTNLPDEQAKMVQLIRDTDAQGVLFISGDVHWGEISKRDFENIYPLYDVTASGLTEEWYNVENNRFRLGMRFATITLG